MPTAPERAPVVVPNWVGADWLQAAVVGAAAAGVALVVAAVLTAIAFGVGGLDGVPALQTVFAFTAVMLGSDFGIAGEVGSASTSLLFIPLVLVVPVAARLLADRLAPAFGGDLERHRAFAVKVALVTMVVTVVVGRLASIGFTIDDGSLDANFVLSAGRGNVVVFAAIACAVLLTKQRTRSPRVPAMVRRMATPVRLAATAYGVTALAVFALSLIAALVEDAGSVVGDLPVAFFALLGAGGTIGTTIVSVVLGSPISVDGFVDDGSTLRSADASTHLLASDVAMAAKLLILVAPVVIAVIVWRHVQRNRPADQRELTRTAALTGVAFAVLSAVGAYISSGSFEFRVTTLVDAVANMKVSVSVGAVLLLGALWGLLGAFGGAIAWGHRNGMPLVTTTNTPTAGE